MPTTVPVDRSAVSTIVSELLDATRISTELHNLGAASLELLVPASIHTQDRTAHFPGAVACRNARISRWSQHRFDMERARWRNVCVVCIDDLDADDYRRAFVAASAVRAALQHLTAPVMKGVHGLNRLQSCREHLDLARRARFSGATASIAAVAELLDERERAFNAASDDLSGLLSEAAFRIACSANGEIPNWSFWSESVADGTVREALRAAWPIWSRTRLPGADIDRCVADTNESVRTYLSSTDPKELSVASIPESSPLDPADFAGPRAFALAAWRDWACRDAEAVVGTWEKTLRDVRAADRQHLVTIAVNGVAAHELSLVAGHVPLVSVSGKAPQLLTAPALVVDALALTLTTRPKMTAASKKAMCVFDVALTVAQCRTALELWEPNGDGPLSNLAAAAQVALSFD